MANGYLVSGRVTFLQFVFFVGQARLGQVEFKFLDAHASLDFVLSVTKIGVLSLVERFLMIVSNWLTA